MHNNIISWCDVSRRTHKMRQISVSKFELDFGFEGSTEGE